jgi:putative flippase GtrA
MTALRSRLAPQLSLYTLASAAALGLDVAVYMALAALSSPAALAGAAGYTMGVVANYLLCVRFVFDAASAGKSSARLFSEFVASGMVGLAVTAAVLFIAADVAGAPLLVAKGAAVGASFAIVFLVRRGFVFAAAAARAPAGNPA